MSDAKAISEQNALEAISFLIGQWSVEVRYSTSGPINGAHLLACPLLRPRLLARFCHCEWPVLVQPLASFRSFLGWVRLLSVLHGFQAGFSWIVPLPPSTLLVSFCRRVRCCPRWAKRPHGPLPTQAARPEVS